jgi:hypothetical protein
MKYLNCFRGFRASLPFVFLDGNFLVAFTAFSFVLLEVAIPRIRFCATIADALFGFPVLAILISDDEANK